MGKWARMTAAVRRGGAWLLPAGRRDWVAAVWAEAREVPPGLPGWPTGAIAERVAAAGPTGAIAERVATAGPTVTAERAAAGRGPVSVSTRASPPGCWPR